MMVVVVVAEGRRLVNEKIEKASRGEIYMRCGSGPVRYHPFSQYGMCGIVTRKH